MAKMKRKPSILLIYLMIIAALAFFVLLFSLLYNGGGANQLAFHTEATQPQQEPGVEVITPSVPTPSATPLPSLEGRLIPYLENGLWGYKNTSGQVVLAAAYSNAMEFDGNVTFAAKNGLYGLINRKGVFIAEPQWLNVLPFSEGYAAVAKDGSLWGYIDQSGTLVIDYSFREAKSFHCGRAAVRNGSAYGYIDTQGVLAISEKWRDAGDFSEDVAFAVSDEYEKDRQYIINKVGTKVATLSSSSRGTAFSDGFAMIRDTSGCFFINSEGSTAFRTVYEDAGDFSGGYAAVKIDGKWGYINEKGVLVIEVVFQEALPFSNGLAAVCDAETGLWGYVEATGYFSIEPQYDEAQPFADGYAVVKAGNSYRIIDKDNNSALLYDIA